MAETISMVHLKIKKTCISNPLFIFKGFKWEELWYMEKLEKVLKLVEYNAKFILLYIILFPLVAVAL